MFDILQIASDKLDHDKCLLDDTIGIRAEEFLNAQDDVIFGYYNEQREVLAKAERKVFDTTVFIRIYRTPVILLAIALLITSLPSDSATSIALYGFYNYLKTLTINWYQAAAMVLLLVFFAGGSLKLHYLTRDALSKKKEWLAAKKRLTDSEQFITFQSFISSSVNEFTELPSQPSPLNSSGIGLYTEPKLFPQLLDQVFAKIRFTQKGLSVKKVEAFGLIGLYFGFLLLLCSVFAGLYLAWNYFFGTAEIMSLKNILATIFYMAAMSIIALPNTDYNNCQLQLGGLYCDAVYYIDLLGDVFGLESNSARKELYSILSKDKRFDFVDIEIFNR